MRFLFYPLAILATVLGLFCLGYAALVPYIHGVPADPASAAAAAIYQKGMYYGVLAVALFSFAGLTVAFSGGLRRV